MIMSDYNSFVAGQQYIQQNPQAEKPTEQQIPNYEARIAFGNGMDSAKN